MGRENRCGVPGRRTKLPACHARLMSSNFLFLNVRCDVSEVELVAASPLERKPLLVIVS